MEKRWIAAYAAALVVVGIGGCSSKSPALPQPPGSLPPVTAHLTINGQDAGTTRDVNCSQVDGYFTIRTGDEASGKPGVTAVVQTVEGGEKLAARSVQIRDISGFTGSFWDGVAGKAEAKVAGNTYTITGTADGFNSGDPTQRTTEDFQIKAAC